MSATTTKLMTADELLVLPHHDEHGDFRCELIRGELKRMSPTGLEHGILCARLAALLINFVDMQKLGTVCGAETGFKLESDPDTVVGADVAYISRERLRMVKNVSKFFPGAPDLAVEVISPGNTVTEIDEKIDQYFRADTRLVWIVNPNRRTVGVYTSPIEVKILREDDALDGGAVLPGFRCELAELFAAVSDIREG